MAYQEALEAAGATVHVFKEFGSYQGEWWALVTCADGRKGWVNGSYGSCSGCDAFDAEFGYGDEWCSEHAWDNDEQRATCAACIEKQADYNDRLKCFGAGYLDDLHDQAAAEKEASRYIEWDSEAPAMVEFIRSHAPTVAES